jgi:dTDP-4-dehydrorhamnose 3,5-epimerase-like enzyme
MESYIPTEIAAYFKNENFVDYPLVSVPQEFLDDRGLIRNVADGTLGDVAVIESNSGSVRANHYHREDWHLCYLISGAMEYAWKDSLSDEKSHKKVIAPSQMIFTPAMTPHRIKFLEDSIFISISKLSRISKNYENDTFKIEKNFF